MPALNPNEVLTPSEVVFLNAAAFAPKGGLLDKYTLLDTGVEVSKKQLALNACAAAFVADDCAAGTRLELRTKKAMLGLRSVQALYAEPAPSAPAWPQYSLEAALQPLARRLQAQKGQHEVANIMYARFEEDDNDPYATAINMIRGGLANRGLLQKTAEKKLKILTVYNFSLPAETANLAAARLAEVQGLLAGYRSQHADDWSQLLAQVDHGIKRRQKQTEQSFDN